MRKELVTKQGRIRAKINAPGVNLDINVADSAASLREVRKIIDALNQRRLDDLDNFELEPGFGWGFTDELRQSRGAMEFVKQAQCAEEGTVHRKISLDNIKVFDAFKKEQYSKINHEKAKELISSELKSVNASIARFAIVHIISTVSKDDKAFLVEFIRKQLSPAEVRTHFTHKDVLGKTVVEMVLFGGFPKRQEF